MVIGVDCDEVVMPLPLTKMLNKKYGKNVPESDNRGYDFWSPFGITKEKAIDIFIEFACTPEFLDLKPYEGALEGLLELKKIDELYLITSRPHSLKERTEQHLAIQCPNIFSKIITTNSFSNEGTPIQKRKVCRDISARLMIEDHYDTAREIAEDIPVILINRFWNKDKPLLKNMVRAYNLQESADMAKRIYGKI